MYHPVCRQICFGLGYGPCLGCVSSSGAGGESKEAPYNYIGIGVAAPCMPITSHGYGSLVCIGKISCIEATL